MAFWVSFGARRSELGHVGGLSLLLLNVLICQVGVGLGRARLNVDVRIVRCFQTVRHEYRSVLFPSCLTDLALERGLVNLSHFQELLEFCSCFNVLHCRHFVFIVLICKLNLKIVVLNTALHQLFIEEIAVVFKFFFLLLKL